MVKKKTRQSTENIHREMPMERLNVLICGTPGVGKRTLIERLHTLAGYTAGTHGAQRAGVHFLAAGKRCCVMTDIPGNEMHRTALFGAASGCDVAIVVVDARSGITPETRELAFLLVLFGIRRIALVVNQMDQVDFNPEIPEAIDADFRTCFPAGKEVAILTIPVSAALGENLVTPSGRMPWHREASLTRYLETVSLPADKNSGRLVFPVQDTVRITASPDGISGQVMEGLVKTGDTVRVTSSGTQSTVKRIVTMDGDLAETGPGLPVVLVLDPPPGAVRGDILSLARTPLESTDQFEACIAWIGDHPGLTGRTYAIRLANQDAAVTLTSIKYRINPLTSAHEACRQLQTNSITVCNIALSRPLAFDTYENSHFLGAFILSDCENHATVAFGMIRHSLRRAQNIHRQALSIKRPDRERLNGHPGKVVWFTGLSGSGKSTLANALEVELHHRGMRTYILDGDNVRHGLNKDLGFTDADRVENIRRIAEVSRLMVDAGLIVMTAFISPFRREREMARELVGNANFIEVHVTTSLDICEKRDPKGLYKQARAGAIPNMTGINSPYEPPENPDYEAHCGQLPVEEIVEELVARILA